MPRASARSPARRIRGPSASGSENGNPSSTIARLLVGVDVEREALAVAVRADLLEPVGRARADGVGGEPDGGALARERLDLAEVVRGRGLAKALEAAARVGAEQEDDLDLGRLGRRDRRPGLRRSEVVELADGRVAGGAHLAVGLLVLLADRVDGLLRRELEHQLAPGPEVAALGTAAQRPLEGVAVRVHEARQRQCVGHRATLSNASGTSIVVATIRSQPEEDS